MALARVAVCVCTVLITVHILHGCNQHELIVNRFENCIPNSLIKLEKFGLSLDADCNIIPSGCIITTKTFTSATVHYTFNKPPIPTVEGTEDLCVALKQRKDKGPEIKSTFEVAKECPVHANKTCGGPNKKISIMQHKNRLPLYVGNFSMKVEITHNNGVSCIDMHMTLRKIQKG